MVNSGKKRIAVTGPVGPVDYDDARGILGEKYRPRFDYSFGLSIAD